MDLTLSRHTLSPSTEVATTPKSINRLANGLLVPLFNKRDNNRQELSVATMLALPPPAGSGSQRG
eukprot:8516766-Lingulodinium_polyedra.AAC.1